jgi:hypothetical protein
MSTTIYRSAAQRVLQFCVTCLVSAGWLQSAYGQLGSQLFLKEIGEGPATRYELELGGRNSIAGSIVSLTAPNGEIFSVPNPTERRTFGELLRSFTTLEDAFTFLPGVWQGTYAAFPPRPEATGTPFKFIIDPIPTDAVYRVAPQNLTVADGDRIPNGSTFELGWDYAGDLTSRQTYIGRALLISPGNFLGVSVVSTPRPGGSTSGSGSSTGGSITFASSIRNVPGTSENRFVVSYTATGAPLPVGVELSIGAYTPLSQFVANYGSSGTSPFNAPPTMSLAYLRAAEPRVIYLTVPEPSAVGLAALAVAGLWRTTCRRIQRGPRSSCTQRVDGDRDPSADAMPT